MTEMDGRDRFHEANILLSNTLKQLDEVMSKGRLHDVRASSMPNDSFSSLTPREIDDFSPPNGRSRLIEDYRNGNPKSAFTVVGQMSNSMHRSTNGDFNANRPVDSFHSNGNLYTSSPLTPNALITSHEQRLSAPSSTWEENAHRDTNSIDSMAESSTGESPLSEIHSSSTDTSHFAVEKFIKAIEAEKLPVPDLRARYKILKWIHETGANGEPASARLAEEILRTRPISELQRNTTQSATSVDLAGAGLRNASSGVSITFREGRGNIRSTLSSGSSFSYLPPPPPYRFRSGTSGSDGLSESSTSGVAANVPVGAATPRLIQLSAGAIRIGGGPLPPELVAAIEDAQPSTHQQHGQLPAGYFQQQHQHAHSSYQPGSGHPIGQHHHQQSLQTQHFNLNSAIQSAEFTSEEAAYRQRNVPVAHRIHRSFSDSKYGVFEPNPRHSRLSTATVGREMTSYSALPNYSSLGDSSSLRSANKMGNSDPYVGNRGTSWTSLSPSPSMSTVSCPEYPELQEKLRRLALTRDTLTLQVDVLNDQVVAQKEKIRDLESLLDTKRKMYSYETLSEHPSAANQADLLHEISELKSRFTTVQREKAEAEKRLQNSQTEIERLTTSIQTLMNQYNIPVQKLLNMSAPDESHETAQLRQVIERLMADNEKQKMELNSLRTQLKSGGSRGSDGYSTDENGLSARGRSTPNASHPQANGTSPAPTPPFHQKPPQSYDINAQLRKLLVDDVKENMAHSSSFPASLCSSVHVPPPSHHFQQSPQSHQSGPAFLPRSQIQPSTSYLSSLSANAAPTAASWDLGTPRGQLHHTTSMFAQPTHSFADGIHGPASPAARQLAAELDEIRRGNGDLHLLPPHTNNLFSTSSLPRSLHSKSTSTLNIPRSKLTAASGSAVGGELIFTPPQHQYAPRQYPLQPRRGSSLFGSSAISADGSGPQAAESEIRANNFNRGNGIRPSASARVVSLGAPLTGNIPIRPLVNQFCDWSTEVVCEWMAEVGFGQYVPDAERNVRSGRHLLNMTNAELEKDLRCLLNCIERNTSNTLEPADRMDVHQVMLWLDDIGLPQYRDTFAENMIDGQMLLCLTVQDLVEMKIVTAMNHATIARGIQFLRSVDFTHQRMIKTFRADVAQMDKCPDEVEKWAHSCVIQWLKEIDLKEFTPNLMFSGVHGALMVHDPTFTAESLAEVLQIPAHKTLLRRHLSSHFNKILGQEIISYKRELLTQPNVTFLTPSLRIRLVKKGFSLGRKGKNEIFVEPDLLVCPTDVSMALSSSRSSNSFVDTSNV
ncbi:hypothetical protein M3Y99_00613300 [Aphelenchoides fujianensis]|nr:hypothetical protein M3Y99_00613300 [Aphelenchoides fujianensis]